MRSTNIFLATLVLVPAVVMAQAKPPQTPSTPYMPPGKLGPAGKVILKSQDARGRIVYSDHHMDGVRVTQTYQQNTFTAAAEPMKGSASAPQSGDRVIKPSMSEEEVMAKNKKIDEANAAIVKKNCETARRELSVMNTGRRISTLNAKGETMPMDPSDVAAQKSQYTAYLQENCGPAPQ